MHDFLNFYWCATEVYAADLFRETHAMDAREVIPVNYTGILSEMLKRCAWEKFLL